MNEAYFSIIVPVYNGEEFLNECLDNLLGQEYDNYEVIVINDGSKDNTERILEEYSGKNTKIRYFTIPNGGVSNARNVGISKAMGDYVVFADADDILDKKALKVFNDRLNDGRTDIVFASNTIFRDDVNKPLSTQRMGYLNECDKKRENVIEWCFFRKIHTAVWANAYKKKIITDNGFEFNKNYAMNEDGDWLFRVVLASEIFEFCDEIVYYYRRDPNASNYLKLAKKYAYSSMCVNSYWYDYFKNTYKGGNGEKIRRRIANGYLFSAFRIYGLPKEDYAEMKSMFLKRKDITDDVTGGVNKLLGKVLKICGFEMFLLMLYLSVRIKTKNI